ncbi:class I SAM-dependent methyltransferase [Campylobacter ureolyticus]|uniref:class I SAM-dependent methyltransferase n=1 Tax=Campylobacter ureolyticus TaxID=827 RepID=UPI00261E8384|nr:class I SAM-dependent methyltransferase [Campylobacter ureolyticus]
MSSRILGHTFMKNLGRTKLRPGGGVTTKWLLNEANIQPSSKILEVGCNHADNIIGIYNEYKCDVKAIDLDDEALQECRQNLNLLGFEKEIEVFNMDAKDLKFPDATFDIVINEAMLTMLNPNDKKRAVLEYHRVLKQDGLLLTHDIAIVDSSIKKELSQSVNMNTYPLTKEDWFSLFESNGFKVQSFKMGRFLLLDKETIIKDEGAINAAKFYKNAQKEENKEQFAKMLKATSNKSINYIAIVSKKI